MHTQTNTHKHVLSAQYQYILACCCCVLPSLLYSLLSEKLQHILPAGSLSDYLTALGLAWQPAKGGWGRRGDERGRRREELARDVLLGSTCVRVCLRGFLCIVCARVCAYVCGCSKSINVRKFTKSISEPILECQIRFPAVCMQVLLQLGMLWQWIRLYGSVPNMLDSLFFSIHQLTSTLSPPPL